MKKVLVMDCSLRNGYTKAYTDEIIKKISNDYEIKLLSIKDKKINECVGCCACLISGSKYCPSKEDDVKEILDDMIEADGIIFLVPNYSFQVPGKVKILLDRLAYVFHRPRFFNKVFMPIVVQGVYNGRKICKYLNEVLEFWGARIVKGTGLQGGVYIKEIEKEIHEDKNVKKINNAVSLFNNEMSETKPKKPKMLHTILFYMRRSSMIHTDNYILPADKQYFLDQGWDKSVYFYPVKLGFIRNIIRKMFDK
jgi:multimeric flavodoxin WrbA